MSDIKELLRKLKSGYKKEINPKLPNTKETWERIGSRDGFEELDMTDEDLNYFLKEWIGQNPYSNIGNE